MKVIGVRDHYGPVNNVNELEFINGFIYANRWGTDFIMKIDPASGIVVGRINLDNILQKNTKDDLSYLTKPGTVADSGAVLNGIAWDSASNRMIITGKLWPAVFEIQLSE
jgi:glutamine cyclotransferase